MGLKVIDDILVVYLRQRMGPEPDCDLLINISSVI